ncbi:MAG TPA: group III truncated hemoglobin [Terriglobales bacterium]|nr:group III truncated hemoglobin [Terriglobales bacterium]
MKDIAGREDIGRLLQRFYEKALADEVIGYIFVIAELDLEHHLPIIGDFWDSMLFGKKDYQQRGRNPVQIHLDLHQKTALKAEHFARWLKVWTETVDELFAGEHAELIKMRAHSIGERMLNTISCVPDINPEIQPEIQPVTQIQK